MSLQADKTICRLSVILGVFQVFENENRFARVDIRQAIRDGKKAIEKTALEWPVRINNEWCTDRWARFKTFVFEAPDAIFQDSCAFAAMCERVMADLEQEYGHNQARMALLNPIHEVTRLIHDFCDVEGKNFVAYDRSDVLMNKLDEILEMK